VNEAFGTWPAAQAEQHAAAVPLQPAPPGVTALTPSAALQAPQTFAPPRSKEPAAHGEHAAAPPPGDVVPPGQTKHEGAPAGAYVFAFAQGAQVCGKSVAAGCAEPAAQGAQAPEGELAWKLPGAHGATQSVPSASALAPAAQGAARAAPPAQEKPAPSVALHA